MIIVCTNCSTKFKVADNKIPSTGTKVRCSKCKTIFRAFPPENKKPSKPPQAEDEAQPKTDVSLDFELGDSEGVSQPLASKSSADAKPKKTPKTADKPPAKPPSQPEIDIVIGDDDDEKEEDGPPISLEKPKSPPKPAQESFQVNDKNSEDLFDFDDTGANDTPPPPIADLLADESPGLGPTPSLDDLDSGLDDLLTQATPESDLPVTLPEEIDLPSLAAQAQTPNLDGPRAGADLAPLPSKSAELTDDGIELINRPGGSPHTPNTNRIPQPQLGAPPSRPLVVSEPAPAPKTLSPLPTENIFGSPTRSASVGTLRSTPPTYSAPTRTPFQNQTSFFKRLIVFFLFSLVLTAGFCSWALFRVHGKIDIEKLSWPTFKSFALSFKPGAKSTGGSSKSKAGDINIKIENTTPTFVRNVDNRLMLVISGEAVNQHETPRSFIKVKTLIFATDGSQISEREIWAGNSFSREEIYYFRSQDAIDAEYSNTGRRLSNMNVAIKARIPFQMIVLNPPESWDTFKVIALTSQEAAGN